MRRGDYFVSRLDAQAAHRDVKRIRSVRTGDAVFDIQGIGPRLVQIRPRDAPRMNAELAMTSAIAASMAGLMLRYWAWRSTKGIFMK